MGLLGTGGTTHGATAYVPNRWYHIELRFDWERKAVAFYVDRVLQTRGGHIPFRRESSSYIGACALGNRDKCTTWFDCIQFVTELPIVTAEAVTSGGQAEAWLGPLREGEGGERSACEGFVLRAEDDEGHVSEVAGPLYPLGKVESAQRVSINNAALADFSDVLKQEHTADVIFVVEGRELPAHRCILTARCEAFRGMFNSSMREGSRASGEPVRVDVQEVSHAGFEAMLRFIYSGAIHVPEELAVELLGLADRYLLEGLKLLCGFTLARMVSVETVSRILQAADRWDSPGSQLKRDCMAFVKANYEEVVSHPVFEELTSSPHLLLEIARAAAHITPRTRDCDSPLHPSKRLRRA